MIKAERARKSIHGKSSPHNSISTREVNQGQVAAPPVVILTPIQSPSVAAVSASSISISIEGEDAPKKEEGVTNAAASTTSISDQQEKMQSGGCCVIL
jgi:hypothetical protein